jgi:hypothetical protein
MAKNKKKKTSTVDQQKQLKLRQAQNRNLFEEKLRAICALMGDKSLYDLIPYSDLTAMYTWRGQPLTVDMAEGAIASQDIAGKLESILKRYLDEDTIELIPRSGIKVSLSDYFSTVLPMETVLQCSNCTFPGKKRFNFFIKNAEDRFMEYENRLITRAQTLCHSFDDIYENEFFTCAFKFGLIDNDDNELRYAAEYDPLLNNSHKLRQKIIVSVIHVEEKQVRIRWRKHLAKRVGVVRYDSRDNPEMFTLHATPKQLKIKHANQDLQIKVYITQQAINLLYERTGGMKISYAMMNLYVSIANGIYIPLFRKIFLMEYRLMDYKIGYVSAELTDGILLLSNFFLLTHPCTPEGLAIKKLAKKDAAYKALLKTDSLKPLIEHKTLENDEGLANLFISAGCKPIVDFCHEMCNEDSYDAIARSLKDVQLPDFPFKPVVKNDSRLNKNEEFLM